MSLFEIIKDLFRGMNACNKMPLHFTLNRAVVVHGVRIVSGKYDFVSHDSLENLFIYRTKNHRTISISLEDFNFLKNIKAVN